MSSLLILPREILEIIINDCDKMIMRQVCRLLREIIDKSLTMVLLDYKLKYRKKVSNKIDGLIITRPICKRKYYSPYTLEEQEFRIKKWPKKIPRNAYIWERHFKNTKTVARAYYSIFKSLPSDVVIHVPWVFNCGVKLYPAKHKFVFHPKKAENNNVVRTNILKFLSTPGIELTNYEDYDTYLCDFIKTNVFNKYYLHAIHKRLINVKILTKCNAIFASGSAI